MNTGRIDDSYTQAACIRCATCAAAASRPAATPSVRADIQGTRRPAVGVRSRRTARHGRGSNAIGAVQCADTHTKTACNRCCAYAAAAAGVAVTPSVRADIQGTRRPAVGVRSRRSSGCGRRSEAICAGRTVDAHIQAACNRCPTRAATSRPADTPSVRADVQGTRRPAVRVRSRRNFGGAR